MGVLATLSVIAVFCLVGMPLVSGQPTTASGGATLFGAASLFGPSAGGYVLVALVAAFLFAFSGSGILLLFRLLRVA